MELGIPTAPGGREVRSPRGGHESARRGHQPSRSVHSARCRIRCLRRPRRKRELRPPQSDRGRVEDERELFPHICLSGEVRLNVDLDVTLTVIANGGYRWLARQLKGFDNAKPKLLYRKFVGTGGQIEVEPNRRLLVTFDRRSHNLILREAALDLDCPARTRGKLLWLLGGMEVACLPNPAGDVRPIVVGESGLPHQPGDPGDETSLVGFRLSVLRSAIEQVLGCLGDNNCLRSAFLLRERPEVRNTVYGRSCILPCPQQRPAPFVLSFPKTSLARRRGEPTCLLWARRNPTSSRQLGTAPVQFIIPRTTCESIRSAKFSRKTCHNIVWG